MHASIVKIGAAEGNVHSPLSPSLEHAHTHRCVFFFRVEVSCHVVDVEGVSLLR